MSAVHCNLAPLIAWCRARAAERLLLLFFYILNKNISAVGSENKYVKQTDCILQVSALECTPCIA